MGSRSRAHPAAAGGQAERDRGSPVENRETERAGHVRVTPRLSQVTTLRSISATTAKRTIAITDEQSDRGEHPGRQQVAGGDQDLMTEAGAGARPFGEHRTDHRDRDCDLRSR